VRARRTEIAAVLLDRGADPSAPSGADATPPVAEAIAQGSPPLAALILARLPAASAAEWAHAVNSARLMEAAMKSDAGAVRATLDDPPARPRRHPAARARHCHRA
jgi:hypothetical protein